MPLSFNCSAEERQTIREIVIRAQTIAKRYGEEIDTKSTHMDITACHANGNPLRLEDLLAAEEFNFTHDVFGISRHINRETGKLENCFRPRFTVAAPT